MNASNSAPLLAEEIALCRAAYESARRPKMAAALLAQLREMEARYAALTNAA